MLTLVKLTHQYPLQSFRTRQKPLSTTIMKSFYVLMLGSLSVAGVSSQTVVTERIGYCGVLPSSLSPTTPTSTSTPTSSPSAAPPAFLAGYQPSLPIPPQLRRRQVQEYITADGQVTSDCTASAILAITPEGELSAGDGGIYSTSQGIDSGPFIASKYPGDISTTWLVSDGTLHFTNASFQNGAASICASGGSVEAYYLSEPPPTCSPGVLRQIPLSACSNPTSTNSSATTNTGAAVSNGPSSTGTIIGPYGNLSTNATLPIPSLLLT